MTAMRRLIDTPKPDIGALVELIIQRQSRSSVDRRDHYPEQFSNLLKLLAENGRLAVLPKDR